jgi:citrate lyase gamma subunit
MADDYQFKEAFSDAKKLREATETGTDADGNPILRNVVAVEPGSDPLDVSAATVTVTDDGQLDINSLPNVTVGTISDTIGVSSLPTLPAGNNNIGDVDVASLPNVTIGSENADLATQTTLSSVLSELQSALDVSGATVTTTDDGNFNVTLDAQNAGLAQESTLADQESYDGINIGPATDSVFTTAYNGILLASVDGDVEVQTGDGNTKTIPQSFFTAGQVLPVTVAEISSTNTTQTISDIMLVRN